ncbi:MAG: beta-carboxysome assembly chaperone CcmS [Microcystaceae cyanobacterium]
MIGFGTTPPNNRENQWRYQLDQFVQDNQIPLAALAWGLLQEWGDSQDALGIDLKPNPHFVRCSRESMEEFNRKVDRQIQEILGILDGYDAKKEVVIVVIGKGQIKLINFQPEPPPPVCFEQFEKDIDALIKQIEERMIEQIEL